MGAVAIAALLAGAGSSPAAVLPGGLTVRAEGLAQIQGGRADAAYQQALDEAFRRAVLEGLRVVAPERQSPRDLELWRTTVLTRADDYVGAWKILRQEESNGILRLEAEVELWRDKLARAARLTGSAAAAPPAVRVLVLAGTLTVVDGASGEELDAGGAAAAALAAELGRHGANAVTPPDRGAWERAPGRASAEERAMQAAAAARRQGADAALILQLSRRGGGLALEANLVAAATGAMLLATHDDIAFVPDRPLEEALAPAARRVAAACAPRLSSLGAGRGRPALP